MLHVFGCCTLRGVSLLLLPVCLPASPVPWPLAAQWAQEQVPVHPCQWWRCQSAAGVEGPLEPAAVPV